MRLRITYSSIIHLRNQAHWHIQFPSCTRPPYSVEGAFGTCRQPYKTPELDPGFLIPLCFNSSTGFPPRYSQYQSVVLNPPHILPTNRIVGPVETIERQQRLYKMQYTRHAARRPYRSAKCPTNEALTAAAMKPLAYNAAAVRSGRSFWYLYSA